MDMPHLPVPSCGVHFIVGHRGKVAKPLDRPHTLAWVDEQLMWCQDGGNAGGEIGCGGMGGGGSIYFWKVTPPWGPCRQSPTHVWIRNGAALEPIRKQSPVQKPARVGFEQAPFQKPRAD